MASREHAWERWEQILIHIAEGGVLPTRGRRPAAGLCEVVDTFVLDLEEHEGAIVALQMLDDLAWATHAMGARCPCAGGGLAWPAGEILPRFEAVQRIVQAYRSGARRRPCLRSYDLTVDPPTC